jgi:hypothetical protein
VLYRPVPVWDITQTARNDGKPDAVAPGAPRLTGDAPAQMWDSLTAHAVSLGYALERGDTGTANGSTNPDTRTPTPPRPSPTKSPTSNANTSPT